MTPRAEVLCLLTQHLGKHNGIRGKDMAEQLGIPERIIRSHISALRNEGIAICAHPKTGYYVAVSPEELESTCNFLRRRSMHTLKLESQLRNIPMADLLGQLKLPT